MSSPRLAALNAIVHRLLRQPAEREAVETLWSRVREVEAHTEVLGVSVGRQRQELKKLEGGILFRIGWGGSMLEQAVRTTEQLYQASVAELMASGARAADLRAQAEAAFVVGVSDTQVAAALSALSADDVLAYDVDREHLTRLWIRACHHTHLEGLRLAIERLDRVEVVRRSQALGLLTQQLLFELNFSKGAQEQTRLIQELRAAGGVLLEGLAVQLWIVFRPEPTAARD